MIVFRVALTVAGAAVTVARHPVVRTALANPQTRDVAIDATRRAAYTAGRIARVLVGSRKN